MTKEEKEQLKAIQRMINRKYYTDKTIEYETKNYLNRYIKEIKDGKPNPFDDIETLYIIIEILLDSTSYDKEKVKNNLEATIDLYRRIINEEAEKVDKDCFISIFPGEKGIIEKGLYDEGFYGLFNNNEDFFKIMKKILSNEEYCKRFENIKKYAISVAKYCITTDILRQDIIDYIEGLSKVVGNDYDKYLFEKLNEARKRVGVYNISPKDLAKVGSELEQMKLQAEEDHIFYERLEMLKAEIEALIQSGKEEINKARNNSIEQLKQQIEEREKVLLKKLDDYMADLEKILSEKSDMVFKEILETYQKQVQEFRDLFVGRSKIASQEFMAIQQATNDSLNKLKTYVSTNPQLQEVLDRASEQNAVRDMLVELVTKKQELLDKGVTPALEEEGVIVPGYEQKIMVPYKHLVLPTEIPNEIIYALDESIPFETRIAAVEEKMKKMENQGEIFHKKIKELIIDIMEGDWPYMWGPSGTGKSYMIKQIASIIGCDLIEAGKITEPHSILGYDNPQGKYQITPTFVAVLYGRLLSLDEFDNGNPDNQVILNRIYSGLLDKLAQPEEICGITFGTDINVDIHPNFRMIAAGNTSGGGSNKSYSSRNKMDESVQERMSPVFIDYDDRVEKKILNDYKAWYDFFINFRKACLKYANSNTEQDNAAEGITTTRDAVAIRKYVDHNSKTLMQIILEKFVQVKEDEYKKALARTIANIYNIDYESCNEPQFNGPLNAADGNTLAKTFIYACREGVR